MSLQIDKDTKVVCARHTSFEFEASYNLGCNDITVRGVCPDCLKEARDADTLHMQRQLKDYYEGHIGLHRYNVKAEYPFKTLKLCIGEHGTHELCQFIDFQRVDKS